MLADPGDDVVLVLVHAGGVKGKALLDAARKAGAVVVECKAVKWESDKVRLRAGRVQGGRAPGGAGRRASPWSTRWAATCASSPTPAPSWSPTPTGTVDGAVVERYHAGRVEVTGFKVADAAVEGRYEEALRLLRHALATGADPVPVNAAFAVGLRTLAKVGGASRTARPDDVARDLGLAPFQVTQGPRPARRLDARTASRPRSWRWPGPTSRSRAAAPTRSTRWSGR